MSIYSKLTKTKDSGHQITVNTDKELSNIPELKLNVQGNKDPSFITGLSPGLKEPQTPMLEPWCELKVRDKFIEKRSHHSSCIHQNKLYVYGGSDLNLGIFSDFYYIDIKEDFSVSHWKPVEIMSKTYPGPISRAASVLVENKWYIFGGAINTCENTNNLWCFNFDKMVWHLIKPKTKVLPPCIDSHSICHYKANGIDYLVIFGGFIGEQYGECWNQVIKYDITNGKWLLPYKEDNLILASQSGPCPRSGHGAVIKGDFLYIFGGTDGEARYNDLWKYDLRNNHWTQIKTGNPPAPRNGHSMVDYKGEGFIIFGGIQDITHEKDDTIYYNYATEEWIYLDKEQTTSHILTKGNSQALENESPTGGSKRADRRRTTYKGVSKFSPPLRAGSRNFPTDSSPTRSPTRRGFSPPTRDMSPDNKNSVMNNSHINSVSDQQKISPAKSALVQNSIEKKRKAFLMKKQMLLKEFEVSDPTLKSELMLKSPTTEAMKNSITALMHKRNTEHAQTGFDSPIKPTDSPGRRAKKIMFNTYSGPFGGDVTKYKIPVDGKLMGQKPCARDGHSAFYYKNKMIVFGGDRHKMSFNDIYILNLDVVFNQKVGSLVI